MQNDKEETIMKKRILFLSLALMFLLCACAKPAAPTQPTVTLKVLGDAAPMPGFDADQTYSQLSGTNILETEDTIFFNHSDGGIRNRYYRLYDKVAGEAGFACQEPGCGHITGKEDSRNCHAKPGELCPSVYYNNQRWWIRTDAVQAEEMEQEGLEGTPDSILYCSDLYGKELKLVKRISYEKVLKQCPNPQFAIHRDNIYLWATLTERVEGKARRTYVLLASPLDETEDFTVLYQKTIESFGNFSVHFAGTNVYCALRSGTSAGRPEDLTVTAYDVATGKTQTLYTEADIATVLGQPWVTPQGELYFSGVDAQKAYLWKVEDGKRVEITTWEGRYRALPTLSDGVAAVFTQDGEVWGCDIRDFSGKTLCQTDKLFPDQMEGIPRSPNWHYELSAIGGDRENLLVLLTDKGSPAYYAVALDLATGTEPAMLWSTLT